jgi:hypothetical protein
MSKSFKSICADHGVSYGSLKCWIRRNKAVGIAYYDLEERLEFIKEYKQHLAGPTLKERYKQHGVHYDSFRWWFKNHKGLDMTDLKGLSFEKFAVPYIEEYKEFKENNGKKIHSY